MSDQNLDVMSMAIVDTIIEKNREILEVLPELSKKELQRVIKNVGTFPAPVPPNAGNETKMTEALYALKDLQIQLAILKIGKQQIDNMEEGE